jgi:hypothetical protein
MIGRAGRSRSHRTGDVKGVKTPILRWNRVLTPFRLAQLGAGLVLPLTFGRRDRSSRQQAKSGAEILRIRADRCNPRLSGRWVLEPATFGLGSLATR